MPIFEFYNLIDWHFKNHNKLHHCVSKDIDIFQIETNSIELFNAQINCWSNCLTIVKFPRQCYVLNSSDRFILNWITPIDINRWRSWCAFSETLIWFSQYNRSFLYNSRRGKAFSMKAHSFMSYEWIVYHYCNTKRGFLKKRYLIFCFSFLKIIPNYSVNM